MKLLLQQGSKVNQEGCHGRRPLHEASHLGKAALVTLLLGAGAQTDPCSHYGLTPLALAAQGGHLEVVETLLKRGERVEDVLLSLLIYTNWANNSSPQSFELHRLIIFIIINNF